MAKQRPDDNHYVWKHDGTRQGRPEARDGRKPMSEQEQQERKQQVLTRKTPSIARSIADAIVLSDGDLFFLSQPSGEIPIEKHHGFGLYYHDCRYLSGFEMRLDGEPANTLVATTHGGYWAVFQLTNPGLEQADPPVPEESLGIERDRLLDHQVPSLFEALRIRNYGAEAARFTLSLSFEADFKDVFDIRGLLAMHPGRAREPRWDGTRLNFSYEGGDGVFRQLTMSFSPAPDSVEGTCVSFRLDVPPGEDRTVAITMRVGESAEEACLPELASEPPDLAHAVEVLDRDAEEWAKQFSLVDSDSTLLNRIISQALEDLRTLRSTLDGHQFFTAGIPWFATLFGRDSVVTALQMLAFDPRLAADTLRLLASLQGRECNPWRDEEPGKMLHELRVGELASMGEIPHTPYYGTVDTTPLFLVLVAQHAQWTGSLELFHELRDAIEAALGWIDEYGDHDGDGFVDYESTTGRGLVNQGWKDSGNPIVNADGSLATPPIALVEVQGYVYMAKRGMARLFERDGDAARAERLRREAEELKTRFNQRFWLEDRGLYAMALQQGGRPAAVASSNPGQALWTDIVARDKAERVKDLLMSPAMFSGWGVRTLSAEEKTFNPIGYHLGTVWPHDNALIAAGLRQYGFDEAALRIFTSLFDAASHFPRNQLPELFCGFKRGDYGQPVRFPVACHPQAWAAGSLPFMLSTMLGLVPEAFDRRLRVVRPMLPEDVDWLEFRNVHVGQAVVDLRFERQPDGQPPSVRVIRQEGELTVAVEPDGEARDD